MRFVQSLKLISSIKEEEPLTADQCEALCKYAKSMAAHEPWTDLIGMIADIRLNTRNGQQVVRNDTIGNRSIGFIQEDTGSVWHMSLTGIKKSLSHSPSDTASKTRMKAKLSVLLSNDLGGARLLRYLNSQEEI